MKYSAIYAVAAFLAAKAYAETHVVIQTDIMSQDINIQATVYDDEVSTFTSGSATSTAAAVEVTSYRSTFVSSDAVQNKAIVTKGTSGTTTVAPTSAPVAAAASVAAASSSAPAAPAAPSAPAASQGSSGSSSSSSSSGLDKFQSTMLNEHNVKRALHKDVGPLTWSSTLASYAQNYANSYSCPSNGALKHSGGSYGENLASGYSDKGTVDAWYDEIKQYNYGSPGFSEATGHFTQLIWKGSQQVGCAYKDCNNEWGKYVVCEYYPMGNIVVTGDTTYWNQNVPPLK